MGEPGVGPMRDRLLLDSGIYRNPFSRSLVSIAPVRWATERLSCNSAMICSSHSRWRQRVSDDQNRLLAQVKSSRSINRFLILHGRRNHAAPFQQERRADEAL
jgi:hypothetical protein